MVTKTTPWGKLNPSGEAHPLTAHMLDVAACFFALTHVNAVRRAMFKLAGRPLTELDMWRLTVLTFLHDVGKANAGFQAKRWLVTGQSAPQGWPVPAGHTSEALFIFENDHLLSELQVNEIATWGASSWCLWRASISHHGRPVCSSTDVGIEIWQPVTQAGQVVYYPQLVLREIGQCLWQWFPQAFHDGPPLPDSAEFVHLFAGLVQFADWLGSDTRFFPYAKPGEERQKWVWQRAKEALQTIG
ncbi:MAG: hypothetical protein RL307_516, partial [Pseudomonadota bacterium]